LNASPPLQKPSHPIETHILSCHALPNLEAVVAVFASHVGL
jgi:hypothetical protein